jgi:hypothetical protein
VSAFSGTAEATGELRTHGLESSILNAVMAMLLSLQTPSTVKPASLSRELSVASIVGSVEEPIDMRPLSCSNCLTPR